jgi:hypothetical protein
MVPRSASDFQPFTLFWNSSGFVPNVFRAQTLLPELVEAEAQALQSILFPEVLRSRIQKESILLAISASGRTYFVSLHGQMLSVLGLALDQSDLIALDHHQASIPDADSALSIFFNTIQGSVRRARISEFRATLAGKNKVYLLPAHSRPISDDVSAPVPEDAEAVIAARVKGGEVDAFEELVRRHWRRLFGTKEWETWRIRKPCRMFS